MTTCTSCNRRRAVLESLDSDLFARVTGLTSDDFRVLNKIGVFNTQHMNLAIYQLKPFETAPDETSHHVGLWDTTIDASEMGGELAPAERVVMKATES